MKFFIFFELSCFVVSSHLTEAAEVAKKKVIKICFKWQIHLAYPASLQAPHSNWTLIIRIEHTDRNKNPSWLAETHSAFYERGRGYEVGTTENKSGKWPEGDSNPGPHDCESDALTTRPHCLLLYSSSSRRSDSSNERALSNC